MDETRVYRLNVASNGFIRQVYANSTGGLVMKGEPLLAYYNSEILPGAVTVYQFPQSLGSKRQGIAFPTPDYH